MDCRLQRIDIHNAFIRDAMRGSLEGSYEIKHELDPMPEELASFFKIDEPVPSEIPEEIDYEARENEALSRAPASCESQEDNYCDSSIYMRCVDGIFTAFDCDQVRWQCSDDDRYGIDCHPIEE